MSERIVIEIEDGYSISEGPIKVIRVYRKEDGKWPRKYEKPLRNLISLEPTDIGAAEALGLYFQWEKQEAEKAEASS